MSHRQLLVVRRSGSALASQLVSLLLLVACAHSAAAPAATEASESPPPPIEKKTQGMERRDGYLPIYWDKVAGKLFLEVPHLGEEMIHYSSLPQGLGSNDVGLDRGQMGGEKIVRFERVGPRVLLLQPNYGYRAVSDNPDERRAVEQSFATSVLWGFKVEAESGGRVLIDATDFVLRDAHGIVVAIRNAKQGEFHLEAARSAVYLERTRAFPGNTELEATLTFTSDKPGPLVEEVTPTPEAVTVRQHLSFVRLPPPGFHPRRFDPRGGFWWISYADMAVPIAEPVTQRFIGRHRLEKKDPQAKVSEPVKPIVYYLDRGVPEPIRTALLDGARWWADAFEAAGFKNAFRVELLPEDADPMDARYNVIQWVHRSTRGWSYGLGVTDPRTGEIIKGHITLGSLRVRQDLLLAEGLLSPYLKGNEAPVAAERMALDRLRQLAAHEVGHSLGLNHNFIASAQGRASVMDYPHPLVRLQKDGTVTVDDAYRPGIGEWDKVSITWGYGEVPQGQDEAAALAAVLDQARARGLTYLTDQDARAPGTAHPQAHTWDNGPDAAAELDRMMQVRKAALARFGEHAIRTGMPMAQMEEVLVPLYLHHRYQVEAAIKVVGGQTYAYALRGDGQVPVTPVPAAAQRKALQSVLRTLGPEALMLPAGVLRTLPPRPAGFPSTRELFPRDTGLVFDALAPAGAAADLVVKLLLDPERAARLIQQHALDGTQPSLGEVVQALTTTTFRSGSKEGYPAEVNRVVERSVVVGLMRLASGAHGAQVRAEVTQSLQALRAQLAKPGAGSEAERANRVMLASEIGRWLERRWEPKALPEPAAAPPGAPIGWEDEAALRELR